MQFVYAIPYKDFKANGRSLFGDVMYDGSEVENLVFGDLQQILRKHGLEDKVFYLLNDVYTQKWSLKPKALKWYQNHTKSVYPKP